MIQTRRLPLGPFRLSRTISRSFLLAALLMSLPSNATASVIQAKSVNLEITTLSGFSVLELTPAFAEFAFDVYIRNGDLPLTTFTSGVGRATSGALSQIVREPNRYEPWPLPDSIYVYQPGTLVLDLTWLDEESVSQHGQFRASLPEFTIRVEREGGDFLFTDYPYNPFPYIPLGAGSFDKNLAFHLGIARQTVGGFMEPWYERFTGDPGSLNRFANANFVVLDISVPEPSSVALLGLAAVGLVARKRRIKA